MQEEGDLLQPDDGHFLLLLQVGALLGQLIVYLAAAHDHPLEPLLLGGVGRPVMHSETLMTTKLRKSSNILNSQS